MRTNYIIGILLTAFSLTLFAQNPATGVSEAGPDKIYINLGLELLSKTMPFDGCVAYRIERRQSGEQSWKQLAEIEAAASKSDFNDKLSDAMKIVPNPLALSSIPVDKIWEKVEKYYRLDSLRFWGMVLPVRIALGITYVDAEAKSGTAYEYRVSKINSAGKVFSQMLSVPVTFPGKTEFVPPVLVEQDVKEKRITLRWKMAAEERPSSFRCYRQDQLQGEFLPIVPLRMMSMIKDSMFLTVSDSLVDPMHIYRYYIAPMDFYGNLGAASDTALVASYDFKSVPLPDNISAKSLDSIGGIQLKWRLPEPAIVKSLKIYRSKIWERGYQQIAEVSAGTGSYIDQNAEPMVKYFYYLVMTGVLGEESPASARIFGIFQSALKPVRPWIIKYEGTPGGVRLEFVSPENDIAGYRVYRGIEGRELSLITDLLQKRDTVTVFIDSSSILSGNVQYGYSVRAENSSHRLSDFSDTVYVRPLKSAQPPVPRDLSVSEENKIVTLYWLDMEPFDQNLDGYFVYRREAGKEKQAEFKKLTGRPLAVHFNRYTDTVAQEGKIFEYAVQSINIYGGTSILSNSVRIEIPLQVPIPPAGVRARSTEEGVVVQWDETIQRNIAGYNVYRYIRGKTPARVAVLKQNELEFTDKKVKRGELYFYYITSVSDDKIESSQSSEIGIRK